MPPATFTASYVTTPFPTTPARSVKRGGIGKLPPPFAASSALSPAMSVSLSGRETPAGLGMQMNCFNAVSQAAISCLRFIEATDSSGVLGRIGREAWPKHLNDVQ
jgi:hypothetical protein